MSLTTTTDSDFLDMFALTFVNVDSNNNSIKKRLEDSYFLMFLEGNECPNYEQCYEVMDYLLRSHGIKNADYEIVYHNTTDTEDITEECKKELFADTGERPFISSL